MRCKNEKYVDTCAVYVTDSFTRTAVTINDNGFYTKSVHFGWLTETDEIVQRNYPRSKVQLALQNKGHIVHFKDGGSRKKLLTMHHVISRFVAPNQLQTVRQ